MSAGIDIHVDSVCGPNCTPHSHIPLSPEQMPITLLEQRMHIQKVDFVFGLLMQFASNPMFAGYFTEDTRNELKRLQG